MEYEEKGFNNDFSVDIMGGFVPLDYTFDMLNFSCVYNEILLLLPQNCITFEQFGLEKMIACEVICSAICHKINWDYLRHAIYIKTLLEPEWLEIEHLLFITAKEVQIILKDYDKKERIRGHERSKMIRAIASQLKDNRFSFTDIFIQNASLKDFIQIEKFFLKCMVFAKDPQQKKLQLLIQTMSDYDGFESLINYYKPTIDYHLMRLFLRRGIVSPRNKYAYQYVFDQNIIRRESTIAALRSVCSVSLKELCWITSLNLKTVNRIEWWVGRSVCTNDNPDCYLERDDANWLRKGFDKCPYFDTCYARRYDQNLLRINEPMYNGNSY